MPRKRFFRVRRKGFRKSYFTHLFEVDKNTCGIGCLFGCPVTVMQLTPDNLYFSPITRYLDKACNNLRNGNGSFNCNFVESVGADLSVNVLIPSAVQGQPPTYDGDKIIAFLTYLYRYWVPAATHYFAYVEGAEALPSNVKNMIDDIVTVVESYYRGTRSDTLASVYATVWRFINVLQSGGGSALFYPVHKLIGHKVSNILRRSGVSYLIYPHAMEPFDNLVQKAANYTSVYSTGMLPNVGLKGMVKFVQKANAVLAPLGDFGPTGEPINASALDGETLAGPPIQQWAVQTAQAPN